MKMRHQMAGKAQARIVSRYTSLASALDVVQNGRLTLLDPSLWPDRNDRACREAYRSAVRAAAVNVLCLTYSSETSHHWSAFANGTEGVRLEFNAEKLEEDARVAGVEYRQVEYRRLKGFDPRVIPHSDLPFVKRWPYQNEREVRLLKASRKREASLPVCVSLSEGTITRIVLSPQLHPALVGAVRAALRSLGPPSMIPKIIRSTLLGNERWIGSLQGIVGEVN